MRDKSISDGSTADYYKLPEGATELQHLISHRNLNAQDGEIFRAIYRKGRASHSDELRDAKKVLFYAQAEVERLEKLHKPVIHELYPGGWTPEAIKDASFKGPVLAGHEIDAAWEEGEKRMEQIGPNGNDGDHYMGGKPLEV